MSCFVVNPKHIAQMVAWYYKHDGNNIVLNDGPLPEDAAVELAWTNQAAWHGSFFESERAQKEAEAYEFEVIKELDALKAGPNNWNLAFKPDTKLGLAEIWQMTKCYQYQAMDAADWAKTKAKVWTDNLLSHVGNKMAEAAGPKVRWEYK